MGSAILPEMKRVTWSVSATSTSSYLWEVQELPQYAPFIAVAVGWD